MKIINNFVLLATLVATMAISAVAADNRDGRATALSSISIVGTDRVLASSSKSLPVGGKKNKKSPGPKKEKLTKPVNKSSPEHNEANKKRFLQQVRITLSGLEDDGPLSDADILLVEDTLIKSWNQIAQVEDPDDPLTARSALVVHEEIVDEESDDNDGGRALLRGGGNTDGNDNNNRRLPITSKYHDEIAIIEYGCNYCESDDLPNPTRRPTPAPTPPPTSRMCWYCPMEDAATPAPTKPPTPAPTMAPLNLDLETNFCSSLTVYPRFRRLSSCSLA
jgi:hypothetical protein